MPFHHWTAISPNGSIFFIFILWKDTNHKAKSSHTLPSLSSWFQHTKNQLCIHLKFQRILNTGSGVRYGRRTIFSRTQNHKHISFTFRFFVSHLIWMFLANWFGWFGCMQNGNIWIMDIKISNSFTTLLRTNDPKFSTQNDAVPIFTKRVSHPKNSLAECFDGILYNLIQLT